MDVFLFSNFFPYKKAEPFLVNEFEYTIKHANRITIFTLYGAKQDSLISPSEKINLLNPIFLTTNKKKLLLRGIFNLSPFKFHLIEFFKQQLFLYPKKLYWFFISILVTRASLSSNCYKDLITEIEKSKAPVLYFYWGDNLSWLIPYLKKQLKNKNLKIVIRLHGSDLYENIKSNYAPLRESIFSAVDLIVPISENGKNYLNQKYPAFANKLYLSRLGVSDNGLNPFSEGDIYHVISVSNIVALKRVHLIFEALQQTNLKIVWHHFGNGPLINTLLELVKSKRTNLEIKFHGHVTNNSLIEFYRKQPINLFLNVSSTEGLPVSIMEAMSFGIPVIATNVGGTSELVSNKTGCLVDENFSVTELTNKIECILNSSEIPQIRKNSRKLFEEKVFAKKNYEEFYLKLNALF